MGQVQKKLYLIKQRAISLDYTILYYTILFFKDSFLQAADCSIKILVFVSATRRRRAIKMLLRLSVL